MTALAVEVLACAGCGGAVPLGAGDALVCPYCHAAVALPPAYRALRDATLGDEHDRRAAAKLYTELGTPPGALVRLFGSSALWWAVLILLPFVFAGLIWIAIFTTDAVERLFHVALAEVLGPARMWTFIGVIITAIVGGAFIGGAYGRRRALGRRALQTILAAAPPKRTGGPAACRECGAPLAVADGALGARCSYCGADNLVAVDQRWIGGLVRDRQSVSRSAAEAAKIDLDERRALRRALVRRAGIVTILFAAAFGWSATQPGNWRREMAAVPRLLTSSETPPRLTLATDGNPRLLPLDAHCEPLGCASTLYISLRRGERLAIRHAGDNREPLTVIFSGVTIGHEFSTRADLDKRALWRDQSIEFQAPHSGFFAIWLVTQRPLTLPVAATLR